MLQCRSLTPDPIHGYTFYLGLILDSIRILRVLFIEILSLKLVCLKHKLSKNIKNNMQKKD